MSDRVLGGPPDRVIGEIFVWIGIGQDGKEGILSMDVPIDDSGERRHMPLFSSNRAFAEGTLAELARRVQRASMHRADRFVKIELRTFRQV